MPTVGGLLVSMLSDAGVRHVFGVGEGPDPLIETIRTSDHLAWIGFQRLEGAALAATSHATLTGDLGVCCANVEADVDQLVVGLCEAQRRRAPVLAIGVSSPDAPGHGPGRSDPCRVLRLRGIGAVCDAITEPAMAEQAIRRTIAAGLNGQGVAYLDILNDLIDRTTPIRPSLPAPSRRRIQEGALRG